MEAVRQSMHAARRVSPFLATEYAADLFFKPMRMSTHPLSRRVIDRAAELAVTTRRGHLLRGWSWGPRDAPPVLLVHGWSGRSSQMAAFVDPLLDRGYRVVAFDLTGHGRSEGRRAHIVSLAEDLLAIGEYVGPLAGVVAHSFGGAVCTLALVSGLRAESLVFVAVPSDPSSWLSAFSGFFAFDDVMKCRLVRRLERSIGVRFEDVTAMRLGPAIDKPLLVLHDEDDPDVPLAHGERIVEHWDGATLVTTRGLGHRDILRDEEVVSRAVRFIAQPTGGAS